MYCRNCGKEVDICAIACMGCGCDPRKGGNFCHNCGSQTHSEQIVCIRCGVSLSTKSTKSDSEEQKIEKKDKFVAAMLALFLGGLGIHRFYLGDPMSGVIRLIITFVGAFIIIGPFITAIWALIEAIQYLCMSDREFERMYTKLQKRR